MVPPWYTRTELGFLRLATFFRELSNEMYSELFEFCCSKSAEPARRQVLSTPSAVLGVADVQAWVAEAFADVDKAPQQRSEWRQVTNFESALARVATLGEIVAILTQGRGAVNVCEVPYSLPGLDVRVETSPGTVRLSRSAGDWRADEPVEIRIIDYFHLYKTRVRVDPFALWITGPELTDGHCLSIDAWSGVDVPVRAASLIERAFGSTGEELAELVHTLVPLKLLNSDSFVSSTNRAAPGALYVMATSRPEMLAEMIVHESGHTWLNTWSDRGSVIRSDAHALLLPSPFTGTARPLLGILHGIVAFSWIRRFWRGLLSNGVGSYGAVAERRLREVEKQVHEGLQWLDTVDAITPLGWELVRRASQT